MKIALRITSNNKLREFLQHYEHEGRGTDFPNFNKMMREESVWYSAIGERSVYAGIIGPFGGGQKTHVIWGVYTPKEIGTAIELPRSRPFFKEQPHVSENMKPKNILKMMREGNFNAYSILALVSDGKAIIYLGEY